MMGEVIRVSGRAPDVGEFLREAMLSQRFADVALCCPGGQRFLAHRLVLSAASPYLQEVLLAHSKAAAHCEPITVILAEVEAPELAAILGFVYTGTATVPRPRLDAFLRAAETLRIRLPPIPVVMTCGDAECKQEDVKDVKINPKYLHCEQYPSCDRWYRADRVGYVEEAMPKKSYGGILTADGIDVSREPRLLADPGMGRGRYSPSRQPCHQPSWPIPVFNQDRAVHGRLDQPLEKERVSQVDARRYHPASIISRPEANEKSPVVPVCDPSARGCQPEFCLPRSLLEVHGRLDPLELRLRTDYRLQGPSYGQGKFAEDETERVISNETLEGERGREEAQSRASLQYTGRTRSYEKPDYGEDLSCGESCCRWRTPRRHVANRVTASPWRQIIRPHHLPKIQPMILQTHADETEVTENARVPETTQPASLSGSPLLHQSPKNPSTNDFYGFEVPTNREFAFNDPVPIPPAEKLPEPTYYPPRVPYPTSQTAPAIPPIVRTTETHFRPTNETPSGMIPSSVDSGQPPAKKSSYFGQNPKPELSHPVSRLCDTIDTGEGRDKREEIVPVVEQKKPEEGKEESTVGRIVVNSDSNNNDAIVSGENAQRGRPNGVQEDHRCEQCGKTFVTRASLKVHSRTHSGEKPFRCADCGKQFSQLRNYKYHRSVHEGTREFAATCPECGKYFNDRGYLSSHMKIHRNRKEYGCAECGKSFNQRVAYNMHVRIHTGVKPHQCEQCGKAFSRKMLLKQHLRTHSGERPYQCQVCQKAFADRSNMTLHTRLHSGLKPYQCTLCSKAFTKKHHLKTHLNYHTGTKPYSCPNCGLRFSQSSNMRTHFKKCAVNNPAGVKNPQADPSPVDAAKTSDVHQVIHRTPTDALTPPNSDQESSILTPISKTVTEPN